MPAFQRQPASEQLGGAGGIGLLDEPRDPEAPAPSGRAALDVAVGRGGPVGLMPKTTMPPSAANRAARSAAAAKAPASGIRWSDGSTSSVAAGSRRSATQAASDHRRQRVAASGSSTVSIRARRLARLVGDQKPRRCRADHDRVGEGTAGEPRDRALERRDATHDRHVLLGEVPPRHRPKPRARAAAENRRNDLASARSACGGAKGRRSVIFWAVSLRASGRRGG